MNATLQEITVTPELWARPLRQHDFDAEISAIRQVADAMATRADRLLQLCAEIAARLCHADSCGISLCERDEQGREIFRTIALAGSMTERLPRMAPRDFSPCGVCVDARTPVLMRQPERLYDYLDVGLPCHDLLLIPLTDGESELTGTIWLISHDPERRFDAEDAHFLQRLAVFAAAALQMAGMVRDARRETEIQTTLLSELDHRVQNAVQIIASVLRAQLAEIADSSARDAVETATRRLITLGQLHRVQTGDLPQIVSAVCSNLVSDVPFRCHLDIQPATTTRQKAVLIALIVNELVTNALKHAFRGRETGTIEVRLRREQDAVQLVVSDDGVPLRADVAAGEYSGTGLKLLRRLARYLDGELRIEPEPKRFTVVFPANDIPSESEAAP